MFEGSNPWTSINSWSQTLGIDLILLWDFFSGGSCILAIYNVSLDGAGNAMIAELTD